MLLPLPAPDERTLDASVSEPEVVPLTIQEMLAQYERQFPMDEAVIEGT